MTERGEQLYATAVGQIGELVGFISTVDEASLRWPCSGREKLGACPRHIDRLGAGASDRHGYLASPLPRAVPAAGFNRTGLTKRLPELITVLSPTQTLSKRP